MPGEGGGGQVQAEIIGIHRLSGGGEGVQTAPLIAQPLHVEFRDGQPAGKAPLGQQGSVFRNEVVAGEHQIGGALSRHVSPTPFVPENPARRAERCDEILKIAALGLKQRLEQAERFSITVAPSAHSRAEGVLTAHKSSQISRKLYNCAAVLCRGEILGLAPKIHLPNYGEFYEGRWFTSGAALGDTDCCISGRASTRTPCRWASRMRLKICSAL